MKKYLPLLVISLVLCTSTNYMNLIKQVDKKDYPESNGLYVYDSTEIFLNPDGSGRLLRHYFVKIFTPTGAKRFSEAAFSYITLYDTIILKKAIVIKPDGRVIKVKKEDVEDIPMPAWKGSKFLIPNLRILKINFPEVEDGCAIECQAERIMKNPPMDSVFDYWDVFEGFEPIKSRVLKIHFPDNLKPNWVIKNDEISHEVIKQGKKTIHIWHKEGVPRIIREPAMPPLPDVAPKLVISTVKSWQDVSSWYYQICQPKLIPDSTIIAKIKDLLKDTRSRNDSLRALYEFVKRNIRYVETELIGKKGGYAPAPISFTFKNQYGVCRDKAALLAGMLRAAGFKNTYTILTNPVIEVEKEIPAPSQFNHAIVALTEKDHFIFFDPTAEWSVEFLTPFEADQDILICTPEGRDLEKTPKGPASATGTDTEIKADLLKDRTAKVEVTVTAKGTYDMGVRTFLKLIPKEKLKQILSQTFKSQYPRAVLDSMSNSDPEDYKTPITLRLFITIPGYATKIGKEWHIGGRSSNMGMRLGSSQKVFNLEERKYPLYLRLTSQNISRTELTYPRFLRVKRLPSELDVKTKDIEASLKRMKRKNTVIYKEIFTMKNKKIPVDRYKDAKALIERLDDKRREELILEER